MSCSFLAVALKVNAASCLVLHIYLKPWAADRLLERFKNQGQALNSVLHPKVLADLFFF